MGDASELKHSPSAPVKTDSGILSGLQLPNGTRAFLGIPYAAPPVEDLRWRPPQPVKAWEGVRAADKFGPSSIQFAPPPTSIYSGGETEFSEDCLYLNVYTGGEAEGVESANRPVLVWLHFGAFLFGSASNPMYNGERMAEKGITVVTVNYRLGRLGFMAHPELTAESGYGGSGNYGIMDQIAALEWVQRNIKSFGGDPSNVTVGGASAGGGTVHILRCSPLGKSLFSKAIVESGPGVAPTIDGQGHVSGYTSLAAAEQAGAELMEHVGVSSIAELRRTPWKQITTIHLPRSKGFWKAEIWPGTSSLSMFDTANPNIDNHVLHESPLITLVSGKAMDVPMLCGHVGNETSGLPYLRSLEDYHTYVKATFGEHADEVLRLYPATTDSEVRPAASQILADQVFIYPTWTSARTAIAHSKAPVWYYKFLRAPPIPQDGEVIERKYAGAFHVAGIPYVLGTLDCWPWNWTDADWALSAEMSNTWAQFIKTGNPNGVVEEGGVEAWPVLKSSSGQVKVWDIERRVETLEPRIGAMATFLDKFYGVEGQISV